MAAANTSNLSLPTKPKSAPAFFFFFLVRKLSHRIFVIVVMVDRFFISRFSCAFPAGDIDSGTFFGGGTEGKGGAELVVGAGSLVLQCQSGRPGRGLRREWWY